MKNKNTQYNHPEARDFKASFGEDLSPVFQDENRSNRHFPDSSRIFTDETRGSLSESQPDNSSYALKLKSIPRIFTDEARDSSTDMLSTSSTVAPKETSYAQHLAAIDRIFSDESRSMADKSDTISHGDQLASMPQIFHETDTSSDHPAARHFKDTSPVFRDESRGSLPNVKLEVPINPVQVSPNQPAATSETEPTAEEAEPTSMGAEPTPIKTDKSRAPEVTSDSDAQPLPIAPIRPGIATPEVSGKKGAETPIDIRRRKHVGKIAIAGLFAGMFFTGRASSNLFGQKAK